MDGKEGCVVDLEVIWAEFDELKEDVNNVNNVNNEDDGNVCKKCKSEKLSNNSEGYIVCMVCGSVDSEKNIDMNAEWRCYNDNVKNPTRCGMNNDPMMQGMLHTYISGNSLEAMRLKKIHMRYTLRYDERKMIEAKNMFKEYAVMFSLSDDIMHNALVMYKNLSNKKDKDGKRVIHRANVLKGLIGACIYYACKKVDSVIARSPEDIAKMMNIETQHINNGCNKLMDIMKMHGEFTENHVTHRDFIPKFRNLFMGINVDIPYNLMRKSIDIADKACELEYMIDYTPKSIGAGALWYIIKHYTKLKVTKKHMKRCCGVSDVTIIKVYNKLKSIKHIVDN